MNRPIAFIVANIAVLASIATIAIAGEEHSVAIKGFDPVSYFTQNKPERGVPELSASYDGQHYQFASAANRERFTANPAKYAPQYGGYCAYGATRGYKAAIDPAAFTVREGKLYLNYSAKVQMMWEADIPGFIKLADEKWPETKKTSKVIP
jgi:YHS domain-containing protein